MNAPIGSLRVDLGFDGREFVGGLAQAQGALSSFAQEVSTQLQALEGTIKKIGFGLSAAITAPFAAMTVSSNRGAGGFEAAMNRVQAALQGISSAQLKEMSKQARLLGPAVGRSAVEAAGGIETLALAGMSAEGILGGGLAATMKLAAASAADLESAGALVSDVMAQFGKTSSQLPPIINMISGALDSSKLEFDDFRLAIGQAGGVAGSAGVSFEDFNTAIAGTSDRFASGSDAGTSFKTFITSLSPKSEEAAGVMEQLGISFFDATGKMKDLAEIAQLLQQKLGGLSDRSRTQALTKMFGTDAMRTAIGLMELGKQGFEDLQATIAKGDAGKKLAIQMQGYEAAVNRLGAAFDNLKISIGETGLLNLFTAFTSGMSNMVSAIAQANPTLLKIGVILWGVAAAVGPLTLTVLTLANLAVPLAIGKLGVFGTAIAALINPIGALAGVLVKLAIYFTGASSALTLFATTLGRFLGPIGLVITALTLLYLYTGRNAEANKGLAKTSTLASKALAMQQEQSLGLAAATGEARKALLAKMAADRASAIAALRSAKADLVAALAARQRARADAAKNIEASRFRIQAGGPDAILSAIKAGERASEQADVDARKAIENLTTLTNTIDGYNAAISAPIPSAHIDMDVGKPDTEKQTKEKKPSGPSPEDLARRREELKLQQMLDVATARGDIEEERRIQQLIDLKRREQEYEDAGLGNAAAKVAAARDVADLEAAREVANLKSIDLAEKELDLQAAQIRGDHVFIRARENELYIEERIQFWRQKGLGLKNSEIQATRDLAAMEAARLDMQQRLNRERALDRAADLSRLRGDTDNVVRRREYEAELARRTAAIAERDSIPEENAREKAAAELDEEDKARLQGDFREAFKGGFHAALDGDFKDWFKNWLSERATKGLEDALNNVADMLYRLFSSAFGQTGTGGGGGGILGAISGVLGSFFGGSSGGNSSTVRIGGGFDDYAPIPGFKTGGQFEVGGRAGIDANLVQFRATKGEMVNIRRPGDRSTAEAVSVNMPITLQADGADPAQLALLRMQFEQAQREMPAHALAAVQDAIDRRQLS